MKNSFKEIILEFISANFINKLVLSVFYFFSFLKAVIFLPFFPFLYSRLIKTQKRIQEKCQRVLENSSIHSFSFVISDYGKGLVSLNGIEHGLDVHENGEPNVFSEINNPRNPGERNSFLVEANINEQEYYDFRLFLVRELATEPLVFEGDFLIECRNGTFSFKYDPLAYYLSAPLTSLRNLWEK